MISYEDTLGESICLLLSLSFVLCFCFCIKCLFNWLLLLPLPLFTFTFLLLHKMEWMMWNDNDENMKFKFENIEENKLRFSNYLLNNFFCVEIRNFRYFFQYFFTYAFFLFLGIAHLHTCRNQQCQIQQDEYWKVHSHYSRFVHKTGNFSLHSRNLCTRFLLLKSWTCLMLQIPFFAIWRWGLCVCCLKVVHIRVVFTSSCHFLSFTHTIV